MSKFRWILATSYTFHLFTDVPQSIAAIVFALQVEGPRGVECQTCLFPANVYVIRVFDDLTHPVLYTAHHVSLMRMFILEYVK